MVNLDTQSLPLSPADSRARNFLANHFADRVEAASRKPAVEWALLYGPDGDPIPLSKQPNWIDLSPDYDTRVDQLRSLTANFISPEEIRDSIARLSGVLATQDPPRTISIPQSELDHMHSLIMRIDLSKLPERVEKIRTHTEWNSDPLIVAFPRTIIVDDTEKPFCVATLAEMLPEQTGQYKKSWYNSNYVTPVQQQQTFPDDIRVYTSAYIVWSKNIPYDQQLAFQEQHFWEEGTIDVDMHLAQTLYHWRDPARDTLMLGDVMRLNACGFVGASLWLYSGGEDVRLDSSLQVADGMSGVGASLSLL